MVITNLESFGEFWREGAQVSVNGDWFTLGSDGRWTDRFGYELVQDANGFHITCPLRQT